MSYHMRRAVAGHMVAILAAAMLPSLTSAGQRSQTASGNHRPNLIFIMADDLGYGDLSCYGSKKIQTPHFDRLAESGIRMTQFYAASAVCTPTRVSCLTGRYPLRFGVTQHFQDKEEHLPHGTVTLPGLLKQAGYATGHVGKWHLGGLNIKHVKARAERVPGCKPGPHQLGFEEFLTSFEDRKGHYELFLQKRLHRDWAKCLVHNDKPVPPVDVHGTEYKVEQAMRLIEKYHGRKRPFFLNLWFFTPHTPYEPSPEQFMKPYRDIAKGDIAKGDVAKGDDLLYRGMVSHMDELVGRLVAKVNELGIAQNTLIVFTSDNGPSHQGSPGPFAGCKGVLYEGGIREPMIAVWPGRIAPGTVSDELAHTNDILPTFCAAAGVPLPAGLKIDGRNILPLLIDGKPIADRGTVFWQMDRYGPFQPQAHKLVPATEVARRGKWKLMAAAGKPLGLFDLDNDPGEKENLLGKHPKIVSELTAKLQAWLREPQTSWLDEK